MSASLCKPFLKWVGGKTQIIDDVLNCFPREINNYHEPCVGGGSVFIALLARAKEKKISISGALYIGDINAHLISVYVAIQKDAHQVVLLLNQIFEEFNNAPSREEYYYKVRDRFCYVHDDIYKRAAIFIFLNKTCFRGVYREGPKGFNVPYGHYTKIITDNIQQNILYIAELIKDVQFYVGDFSHVLANIRVGDFVYIDPPYAPINNTSFTSYTNYGFDNNDHNRLFAFCDELYDKRINHVISNADVELIRNHFITSKYNSKVITCRRAINSRNPESTTNELIIQSVYDCEENNNIANIATSSEDDYVYQTMLTCIGNKRKLVKNIRTVVEEIAVLVNKDKLNIVDGFAGSSVVSRELSYISDNIYTNDLEYYSYLMSYCYLVHPTLEQKERIIVHIQSMNYIAENGPFIEGIISRLYAPKDTKKVQEGERCFYTRENALIIDTLRKYIQDNVELDIVNYCLVPLLNRASIHTNTAGVFKGFYKNDNNLGCFGGKGEFALSRIMKSIKLDIPIWNNAPYKAHISNKDINTLIAELPDDIDVIYLDPPYNSHPYGSNYFMLNVIAKNEEPVDISKVSGIPSTWNKSKYNSHLPAVSSMKHLITVGLQKSKYLLISYNNEGIITDEDWKLLLAPYTVKKYEINYDTFKGCRNLKKRNNKVIEIMYLVSKMLID